MPRTVKLHCYTLFQAALCRPLRVQTLNILLMEGKWSSYDCGQLGHWAEADDSHLFLSLPEAAQYLHFLHISRLNSTSCGPRFGCAEERGCYGVWYGRKRWWQIDAMLGHLTASGLWEARKFQRKTAWRPDNLHSLQFLYNVFSELWWLRSGMLLMHLFTIQFDSRLYE